MSEFYLPLIYLFAFVAVVVLAQAIAGAFIVTGDQARRVNRRLTMLATGMNRDEVYSTLVRKTPRPRSERNVLLDVRDWADNYCRQAGIAISPLHLLLAVAGLAGTFWLIGVILLSRGGGDLWANGLMSLLGACVLAVLLSFMWISGRRDARLRLIAEQLPLGLDIIIRGLRAGHPVISAAQLAANELGDPVGTEFGIVVDETTYGVELKQALLNFARRTGSADAHYFAVAVSIQSETGGNLAEILDGLAKVMRSRGTLTKRVKALASEGKASAYVLSILPVLLIAFTMIVNPKTYTDKFTDPVFWPTVTIILALYIIGWLMIRRIVNFKY